MDIDYTVGEVELSYKPKFKSLHQVTCSEDAYKYFFNSSNQNKRKFYHVIKHYFPSR